MKLTVSLEEGLEVEVELESADGAQAVLGTEQFFELLNDSLHSEVVRAFVYGGRNAS